MANPEHLRLFFELESYKWGEWRYLNPDVVLDLSEADLSKSDLQERNIERANLRGTIFDGSNLRAIAFVNCDLSDARFRNCTMNNAVFSDSILDHADFYNSSIYASWFRQSSLLDTNLHKCNLSNARFDDSDLSSATLERTDLSEVSFNRCKLNGANLALARIVQTKFRHCNLNGCLVYGAAVWDVVLEDTIENDLQITIPPELLTVDGLELAQFLYFILENINVRQAIDSITCKVVLILGRFTPERKVVLDSLRNAIRERNYIPVMFDFEQPASRDLIETVTTLASLSRFIIADITSAKIVIEELRELVPRLSVPVLPILQKGEKEYSTFHTLQKYPWMLNTFYYESIQHLMESLSAKIIPEVETKVGEMRKK